jgi:isocitrate dehydrogenase
MATDIRMEKGNLVVPDKPIIPFIEGDGIGTDITPVMQRVTDAAVEKAYGAKRKITWKEVLAGEKANAETGSYLPDETLEAFRRHLVGIKGPLTTPIGGGFRSLNVAIRQILDLYSCIRPVRFYGSSSPLVHPEAMDLIIFRENTEDVYAGVEYESGGPEALRLISLLRELGVEESAVTPDAAIGIKPIGPQRTKRHVRKALRYALAKKRCRMTFMHKGNIMKFTEGAFMRWAYEVLEEPEFAGKFVTEAKLSECEEGEAGRLIVNDRIADNMFQQILTRTDEYDVIVTTNLNGDYISDAAAAGAGGLGMAPGGNVGDELAIFEATHGSAPKYAGQDKVNPSSIILSAAMMLDHLAWGEASELIQTGLERTLAKHIGTYDLVRGWKKDGKTDFRELKCSEFGSALIENMPTPSV